MTNKQLTIFSGLCFGIWPLSLNRSNLPPFTAALILSATVALVVTPMALKEWSTGAHSITWRFVIVACLFNVSGLVAFNTVLVKTPKEQVGTFFLMMLLVQAATPAMAALYYKGATLRRVAAICGAFFIIVLLGE